LLAGIRLPIVIVNFGFLFFNVYNIVGACIKQYYNNSKKHFNNEENIVYFKDG